MKRTPLKRKTPMKRTAMQPKPRKGMRNKSKTNSRKCEDMALRSHYRDQNPTCELTRLFKNLLPGAIDVRDCSAEVHHIVHKRQRYDLWSNLITVSKSVHDWIHANPIEGTILALWRKLQKNELDLGEYLKAAGLRLAGWLSMKRPSIPQFAPLWEELLAFAEQQDGN